MELGTVRQRQIAAAMTEKELLALVRELAALLGYECYHTYRSTRSSPGFPDLVLARPSQVTPYGDIRFVELKSARGQLTREQRHWLAMLRACRCPGVHVAVWRPRHWLDGTIEEALHGLD